MTNLPHEWVKSTLGHSEVMCRNCAITNREADALAEWECPLHPMLKTHPDPATLNVDPRDPDPRRFGEFRDHNCYRCKSGQIPCIKGVGNERDCASLHARND